MLALSSVAYGIRIRKDTNKSYPDPHHSDKPGWSRGVHTVEPMVAYLHYFGVGSASIRIMAGSSADPGRLSRIRVFPSRDPGSRIRNTDGRFSDGVRREIFSA
jgi:hypothetical protein